MEKQNNKYRKNMNLSKSIEEITTKYKFIIPLYQRNFAWNEDNVSQLLHDIYENFMADPEGNYFIGSLVVLHRENNIYEVIDGQQRLTVLSLLVKYLAPTRYLHPFLTYDSRKIVNRFLEDYHKGIDTQKNNLDAFIITIDTIKNEPLDPQDESSHSLSTLDCETKNSLIKYIFDQVKIVFVEIPHDTDVASYFEIMNNRGEQLQKHEILKSFILEGIKCSEGQDIDILRSVYARIWDACSQMDYPVQSFFKHNNSTEERQILFGSNYDEIHFMDGVNYLYNNYNSARNSSDKSCTIDNILSYKNKMVADPMWVGDDDNENDDEDNRQNRSIIDFPNFLMHVFRLKYNDIYKSLKNDSDTEIPLNEKELLTVYKVISKQVESIDFVYSLLFYRAIFDRYIVRVKSTEDNEGAFDIEDSFKWVLQSPNKDEYKNARGYISRKITLKDTFKNHQDEIVMALSMLQVSQPQRIYKRYLNQILQTFPVNGSIRVSESAFLRRLNSIILETFEQNEQSDSLKEGVDYDSDDAVSYNTSPSRFLFNFIDYLYWTAKKNSIEGIPYLDYVSDFTFRYNNSIEHHLPQSYKGKLDSSIIDSLGNLCLISKSANSRLNNEDPIGKAKTTGKYYRKDLPPKRKIIYDMTNHAKGGPNWGEKEIKEHYNDILKLISLRTDILGFNKIDIYDQSTIRALLAIEDTSKHTGSVWGTRKHNIYYPSLKAKASVLQWRQSNPTAPFEEFICNHLDNEELCRDEWRYAFVKYPYLIDYCKSGNIGLWDDNRCLVMRGDRATDGTSRDLKMFVLYEKLKESYKDKIIISMSAEYIEIKIADNKSSIFEGLVSWEYIKDIVLIIWIDYGDSIAPWLYELRFQRNANSTEVKTMIDRGWMKNDDGGYYYKYQPYLVKTSHKSLDKTINDAFDAVSKLIKLLQKDN